MKYYYFVYTEDNGSVEGHATCYGKPPFLLVEKGTLVRFYKEIDKKSHDALAIKIQDEKNNE